MRDCKRHPSESQSGGGVCASCLRERLTCLWRGESFCLDQENSLATEAAVSEEVLSGLRDDARPLAPQPERVDTTASVRKELVSGVATGGVLPQIASGDVLKVDQTSGGGLGDTVDEGSRDGDAAPGNAVGSHQNSQNSKDVIVEWTEFHARRRRNLSLELDSSRAQSRSFDSLEFRPSVDALMGTDNEPRVVVEPIRGRVSILMSAEKIRSRSMPLDNRSAEETALRVIREQADDPYLDELDFLEGLQDRAGGGGSFQNSTREQRCFSPSWHTRKSPKWVKVLISPMTSRNKVFPSRSKEDARRGRVGSRKRLTRFASSDWSHTGVNGEAAPHWLELLRAKEGMSGAIMRSSVFSWLQDAERTNLKNCNDQTGQPTSSSSSSAMTSGRTDSWFSDLITVGHLHEIAEELEEEDEVLESDSLEDISSFGKFLRSAGQRQPKAGLTRLSSAASS